MFFSLVALAPAQDEAAGETAAGVVREGGKELADGNQGTSEKKSLWVKGKGHWEKIKNAEGQAADALSGMDESALVDAALETGVEIAVDAGKKVLSHKTAPAKQSAPVEQNAPAPQTAPEEKKIIGEEYAAVLGWILGGMGLLTLPVVGVAVYRRRWLAIVASGGSLVASTLAYMFWYGVFFEESQTAIIVCLSIFALFLGLVIAGKNKLDFSILSLDLGHDSPCGCLIAPFFVLLGIVIFAFILIVASIVLIVGVLWGWGVYETLRPETKKQGKTPEQPSEEQPAEEHPVAGLENADDKPQDAE